MFILYIYTYTCSLALRKQHNYPCYNRSSQALQLQVGLEATLTINMSFYIHLAINSVLYDHCIPRTCLLNLGYVPCAPITPLLHIYIQIVTNQIKWHDPTKIPTRSQAKSPFMVKSYGITGFHGEITMVFANLPKGAKGAPLGSGAPGIWSDLRAGPAAASQWRSGRRGGETREKYGDLTGETLGIHGDFMGILWFHGDFRGFDWFNHNLCDFRGFNQPTLWLNMIFAYFCSGFIGFDQENMTERVWWDWNITWRSHQIGTWRSHKYYPYWNIKPSIIGGVRRDQNRCYKFSDLPDLSGWWFGTWILFSMSYMGYYGIILPIDFHIFQRGGSTTNQPSIIIKLGSFFKQWTAGDFAARHF